jgi:hypothetical protein
VRQPSQQRQLAVADLEITSAERIFDAVDEAVRSLGAQAS